MPPLYQMKPGVGKLVGPSVAGIVWTVACARSDSFLGKAAPEVVRDLHAAAQEKVIKVLYGIQ